MGPSIQASPAVELPIGVAEAVTVLAHGASASWLSSGRLFLQHGPINLIVRAYGQELALAQAYERLIDHFPYWLGGLVAELPRLRSAESPALARPHGAIANRMVSAVRTGTDGFVTAMAAVAGAVADEAIAVLSTTPGLQRAYVNNGGDIALFLSPGATVSVGVVPSLRGALMRAHIDISFDSPVRGIATSGWDGRSHSLGIADAVTVLAASAARADAAATLIANEVNVEDHRIGRRAACEIDESSDLGDALVTVEVPLLEVGLITSALARGARLATKLREQGAIEAAALSMQGHWRVVEQAPFAGAPALEGSGR